MSLHLKLTIGQNRPGPIEAQKLDDIGGTPPWKDTSETVKSNREAYLWGWKAGGTRSARSRVWGARYRSLKRVVASRGQRRHVPRQRKRGGTGFSRTPPRVPTEKVRGKRHFQPVRSQGSGKVSRKARKRLRLISMAGNVHRMVRNRRAGKTHAQGGFARR